MKKRILSLFLALVMLFSCMSLTLFAVDEATELAEEALEGENTTVPEAGTIFSNTLIAHTAAMIEKLIPGYDKGTSFYSFNGGTSKNEFTVGNVNADTGFIIANKAARFDITEDGRFVYGAVTDTEGFGKLTGSQINDSYINVTRHSDSSNANTALQNYATSKSKGQNFTVQVDVEITETFINETSTSLTIENSLGIMQISSYHHTKTGNIVGGSWVHYAKLHVDSERRPFFAFPDYTKSGNAAIYADNRYYIEAGKTYTVAVHVDPQDVNASANRYGSYDVYINGECVFEDLGFLSKSYNNTLKKAENVPFFLDSVVSASYPNNTWVGKVSTILNTNQTAYFFTDSFTEEQLADDDNDGLANILESISDYITFDENGKATNAPTPRAIGKCEGAQNFNLGGVRLFQNPRYSGTNALYSPYTTDAYYFDNITVYYGEDYAGTLQEHDLVIGEHKHDFDSDIVLCDYTCTICGGTKTVYETLDANSDRVCDICSGEIGYFGDYKKLTVQEIKKLTGTNLIDATDFSNKIDLPSYGWKYGMDGNINMNSGSVSGSPDGTHTMFKQIVFEDGEDGNVYLKYQRPVTEYVTLEGGKVTNVAYGTEENGDYYYTGSLTGEYLERDPHFTEISEVAKDWDTLGGMPYTISIDYLHYGNYAVTPFELRSPTLLVKDTATTTKTSNISWHPVQIYTNGVIAYRNVETGTWVATNHKIPIGEFVTISFYHTPATNSFDIYVNGLCVVNDIKAVKDSQNVDYTGKEEWNNYGLVGNSAKNYMLSMVRFTQMTGKVEKDVMALDNIKMYYGEFLECDHTVEMTHSHDIENAKNTVTYTCTQCGKTESTVIDMFNADDYRGSYLTADQIKAYTDRTGNKLVMNADFEKNGSADWDSCSSSNNKALDVVEIDGNFVLKYGPKTGTEPASSYTQAGNAPVNSYVGTMQNFATYKGKSYTISISLKLDEDFAGTYNASKGTYGGSIANFFEIICYMAGTKDMTDEEFKATAAMNTRIGFSPIVLYADGNLGYRNYAASFVEGNASGAVTNTTAKNLMDNAWHEITIHHTPANNTYDFFLDGELVEADVTALSKGMVDATTWSSSAFTNSGKGIDYPADAEVDENGKKILSVNGATDFIPGVIRLAQYNPGPNDSMYIDNFKVYYTDEILECLHKDIGDDGVCEDCGKAVAPAHHCEICDGQAISESAAVVGRNAGLGELIHMNAYLKLQKALAADEGAKVVISAKDMTKEYLLSEILAEKDGSYKITLPLRSTYMTEKVSVEIVADGETSVAYTTSVTDYLTELLKTSENETEKALVKATLNYGAYAQLYFAEKNGDASIAKVLANAGLSEIDKDVSGITADALKDYKISTNKHGEIEITGATLVLTSSTIMKLYFKASESVKVTVNGKAQSPIADGEEYYVTINKANPAQLADVNAIVITDTNGTASVNVSILSAVEAVLANGQLGENFENLARAIYLYYEAAQKYTA